MPSDSLISRMQALNGKPLSNVPETKTSARHAELDELLEGTNAEAAHGPGYLLIQRPARYLESEASVIYRRFAQLTGYPDGTAVTRLGAICNAQNINPQSVLFLDIETTGLGTAPVFLIGTMECVKDEFLFRQYFARGYEEEVSILSAVSERLKDVELLVTFNGKTFDMPFIANRATACGIKMHHANTHLDMLNESRRHYKGTVPNCRLQTLERHVCGRCREDDIPSAQIPAAYNAFVRTGKTDKIESIILHNLIDIFTMADIMTRMWRCD